MDKRRHSNRVNIPCFRGADCDTDHYLVVEKFRERLSVSKQAAQKSDAERFRLKNLSGGEIAEQHELKIPNRYVTLMMML
jgi:hypothetical protein